MPNESLQRYIWDGQAIKQGDAIRMRKVIAGQDRHAVCGLWSHQLGWELRLFVDGEWHRSKVCRSQEEVFTTTNEWKAALVEKGWA